MDATASALPQVEASSSKKSESAFATKGTTCPFLDQQGGLQVAQRLDLLDRISWRTDLPRRNQQFFQSWTMVDELIQGTPLPPSNCRSGSECKGAISQDRILARLGAKSDSHSYPLTERT